LLGPSYGLFRRLSTSTMRPAIVTGLVVAAKHILGSSLEALKFQSRLRNPRSPNVDTVQILQISIVEPSMRSKHCPASRRFRDCNKIQREL
jgi:hypothetical protein